MSNLLKVNVAERFTVDQALEHPWMLRANIDMASTHLGKSVENLVQFNAHRKLKGAFNAVRAGIKMKFILDKSASSSSMAAGGGGSNGDKVETEGSTYGLLAADQNAVAGVGGGNGEGVEEEEARRRGTNSETRPPTDAATK